MVDQQSRLFPTTHRAKFWSEMATAYAARAATHSATAQDQVSRLLLADQPYAQDMHARQSAIAAQRLAARYATKSRVCRRALLGGGSLDEAHPPGPLAI